MPPAFPESDQRPLPKTGMRWPSPTSWLVAVVMLVTGVLLLIPVGYLLTVPERVSAVNSEMDQLMYALQQYRADYGAFPSGNDRNICLALQGANAKKIVYIALGNRSVATDGDLLDPWGTPYKFYFSDAELLVRSAGRNKKFESSNVHGVDDYFKGNTE